MFRSTQKKTKKQAEILCRVLAFAVDIIILVKKEQRSAGFWFSRCILSFSSQVNVLYFVR